MFFPESMTEIELIVPANDILSVTKAISGLGIYHQTDGSYLNTQKEDGAGISWQTQALAYAGFERRLQSLMTTLSIKEGLSPANANTSMADIGEIQPVVEHIEHEVRLVNDQLVTEQKKIDQFKNVIQQLEPIIDINLDVKALKNPHYIFSMLGMIPDDNIERLHTSLARISYLFVPLHKENHQSVVWLGGSRHNADVLERAARSAYLNPLSLPEGHQGTPAQIVASLKASIDEAQQKISSLKAELGKLKDANEVQLQENYWKSRAGRLLTEAIVRYGRSRHTYIIVGWVLTSGLENLRQRLKQVSKDIIIETYPASQAGAKQNVPVSLRNPRGLAPFQSLVTMYSRPRYNEIDPTILIAATFPIIYGAMFGDIGQGAILALLGLLIYSRIVRALRSMSGLGGLIMACGVSGMIFGVLYGSVFGREDVFHALWLQPMENIMQILMIAIGAGVVLLSVGLLIGTFNAWKARAWSDFIFDHNGLAGMLLYWSLLALGGSLFLFKQPALTTVFIGSTALFGTALLFSEVFKRLVTHERPLIEGGIGTYVIQAFFELFEILISFLSNSLSYVRIGAFAVAHAGLSKVVFILAEMVNPGQGIGYYLVVAIGTLFIVGFEGLIVGIQTMRLEYYEFFSKFFKGGGIKFEPLVVTPTTEK